jgi:carbon storage regulator
MLVLSRGRNQSVLVGNDVIVTLLDIRIGDSFVRRGKARLGFDAPKEIAIQRQEVFERMKAKTSSGSYQPKPRTALAGTNHPVREATVRLQIQTPPEVSIHCSRATGHTTGKRRIVQSFPAESPSADTDDADSRPLLRVINCIKDDNILIGNQLQVTVVDVVQFVVDSPSPTGA